MADNVTLPGTGVNVASDDIGSGLQLQRVKVAWGPDGSYSDANLSTPLPVQAGQVAPISANFNRPANTTAYTTGDLVANNTAAGSVVPLTFTGAARFNGGAGLIRRAKLLKSDPSLVNAAFRMHLWNLTQSMSVGDNGVIALPGSAAYLGMMEFVMDRTFTDGACGFGLPAVGDAIAFKAAGGATAIFGYLEARAAYVPVSAETFTATLDILQD